MRHTTRIFTATLFVIAFAVAADAQDKRVNITLSGGYTATNGEAGERLGDGYNINFGAQVNVSPMISIEGFVQLQRSRGKANLDSGQRHSVRRQHIGSDGLLREHEHAVRHGAVSSGSGRRERSGRTGWWAAASTTGPSR